jgi:hypothetical protein
MLPRAMVVWFGILLLANVNGALRELLLRPALGDTVARAISTVLLASLVALLAWSTIRWIGPRTTAGAILVGVLWLVLTLAFEFGAGHYLFHKAWAELLADYDLRQGRIWVLVLLVTVGAPLWAARTRGLLEHHRQPGGSL